MVTRSCTRNRWELEARELSKSKLGNKKTKLRRYNGKRKAKQRKDKHKNLNSQRIYRGSASSASHSKDGGFTIKYRSRFCRRGEWIFSELP